MRLLFTKFYQLFIFRMILLSTFDACSAIKDHGVSVNCRVGKLRALLGKEIIWIFISHAL